MVFSRDMIILLIVIITFIPSLIFFLSRIFKYKDDKEKKKICNYVGNILCCLFFNPHREDSK